ncbi:DUF2273 domain-containing protein [Enterococcus sp. RIT-PI-f]|jgi:uncharacterized membrane protein|uniref:DUF2273 domain-containing protein n=1 Tax=Enterococcus sp. RIT-PI-f TaxID=1690244 RepID=UPI0006B9A06F|nr:DUF2273 domain-containing protein [Enterococcus sp. RIT-PI-f]KPG68721.1 hypothetical protein AEQ18_13495 [Enterococcus sp. RIT-PI-f]
MNEIQQYKIPLIFGAIGLIIALLFVTIGFFKTVLILLLTGLGFLLGLYVQRTGILDEFLNRQ